MTKESLRIIRNAMQNAKGDDLERARAAFRNYTQEQLDKPYGYSDSTPREILKQYEHYRTKWSTAYAELNSALGGSLDAA